MKVPRKKKKQIPEGPYCYNGIGFDDTTGRYKIKCCPFHKWVKDEGVDIVYCSLLKEGCIPNGTPTKDYEKLRLKYGGENELWNKYPSSLLWDQVKKCGIKDKW